MSGCGSNIYVILSFSIFLVIYSGVSLNMMNFKLLFIQIFILHLSSFSSDTLIMLIMAHLI